MYGGHRIRGARVCGCLGVSRVSGVPEISGYQGIRVVKGKSVSVLWLSHHATMQAGGTDMNVVTLLPVYT